MMASVCWLSAENAGSRAWWRSTGRASIAQAGLLAGSKCSAVRGERPTVVVAGTSLVRVNVSRVLRARNSATKKSCSCTGLLKLLIDRLLCGQDLGARRRAGVRLPFGGAPERATGRGSGPRSTTDATQWSWPTYPSISTAKRTHDSSWTAVDLPRLITPVPSSAISSLRRMTSGFPCICRYVPFRL